MPRLSVCAAYIVEGDSICLFLWKRTDPPSDLYLTPHSCGEPCGKPLERRVSDAGESKEDLCPHVCVLQCHPGPCPPCKAFAPPRVCPCGKKIITTRCSDRMSVLTCGQRCDKLLECGRHRCEKICHVGTCDPCQVLVNASCFCKLKAEVVLCGDMAVKGEVKAEDGVFSCNSTCRKLLGCGNHECGETCHPGPCGHCDLMPGRVNSCFCGKMSLQEERKSCLDPIPNCTQICGKPLPCVIHHCKEVCHAGDCPPCLVLVTQKCCCGSTSRTVECYKTSTEHEKFTCEKSCGRKKNCGRHRCSERCCPLSNPHNLLSGDWDPHFCQMACGKKLRCGQHSCESLCHSGHCPPCLETIFTDLSCACGRTSIPPPLPCGTPPPSCQLPCSVPQPCGHSASHSCHFGDCPPCSVPIAKECVGGHVVLGNIPCVQRISDATNSVTCGAPRRDCRHTCTALCHPSASCPDVRCELPVTITCSCGRITASVPCDTGGSNSGFNADTVFEASIVQKLPVPLQPVESIGRKIPLGQRKLVCDDECAKLERKRVLADAFDITPLTWKPFILGTTTLTVPHPPAFDPLVDMDPRLVVSFLDLPREADISSLVLRFGGECELVWLNDKNALAVFNDPARAATAMRRLDHGSVYQGAVVVLQSSSASAAPASNPWGAGITKGGGAVAAMKPWKNAVVLEHGWREDSWGSKEWSHGSVDVQASAWKGKEAPIIASINRWSTLDSKSSSNASTTFVRTEDPAKYGIESNASISDSYGLLGGASSQTELSEVVDDWEKAYD
ncbi:hypothetical protein GH714_000767 [Hevea brasiliensis]|uniref:NF-X1-type domain-containing protein n=1 Tax=Hevea brasiliensis TaxID=3981 RepID=A0A6A6M792_HEVBR|nr:hypothetical protein GH714_000767 [Hevea brasiliensis]